MLGSWEALPTNRITFDPEESMNPLFWRGIRGLWLPCLDLSANRMSDHVYGRRLDASLAASDATTIAKSPLGLAWFGSGGGQFGTVSNAQPLETTRLTVFAVFNINSTGTTSKELIYRANNSGPLSGWGVGVSDTLTNRLKFYTGTSGGSGHNLETSTILSGQEWYAATFVYNPQSSGTNKFVYVDGKIHASASTALTLGYSGTLATLIGSYAGGQQWLGKIAMIGVWDRPMAPQEVYQLSYDPLSGVRRRRVLLTSLAVPIIGSGGALVGGTTDLSFVNYLEANGGNVAGGLVLLGEGVIGTGGVIVNGAASIAVIYPEVAAGGVILDSTAIVLKTVPSLTSGGAVVGGVAVDAFIDAQGRGGAIVNGAALVTFFDYVESTGGVVVNGAAIREDKRVVSTTGSGEIVVSGNSYYGITGFKFTGSGEIVVDSQAIIQTSFNLDFSLLWNVRSAILKDVTLLWNFGDLPVFWYRIVGKPHDGNDCNLLTDPCCQQFIVNIHAKTLTELCDKLRARRLNLPITSVHRFSRPANPAEVRALEEDGVNQDCNELIPVEVCQIPACADFCVDFDLRSGFFTFAIIRLQVDSFFVYEGDGSIFVSGNSITEIDPFVPDFPFIGTGSIVMSGEAIAVPNSFIAGGGVVGGGTGEVAASAWDYIGGVWPYEVLDRFPTMSESVLVELLDQPWLFPEHVFVDDANFAQSDVSYGKTSEFLIAHGFNFSIPDGVSILGLTVSVHRYSTNSEVRDLEVYLVQGEDVISDNLADIFNDWPVGLFTTKVYGSSGLDGQEPWRDPTVEGYLGPFTVAELNDADFGFAIRVEYLNPVSVAVARIDFINIDVFYENTEHQVIRVGGEASIVSSAFSYVGSGNIQTSESSDYGFTYSYSYIPTETTITFGSSSSTIVSDVAEGGVIIGGEALAEPYIVDGGVVISGEADVEPYLELGIGGAALSGAALISWSVAEIGSGGIAISGALSTSIIEFGFGGVVVGSSAEIAGSAWAYEGSGSIIVTGNASFTASDLGTFSEVADFSIIITNLSVTFADDAGDSGQSTPAGNLSESISQCGCLTIPLLVNFEHNLARTYRFSQFLRRNGFSIPRILRLAFNRPNNSWQSNLHYRGYSADANTQETWDLVFELQCTSIAGSIDIGRKIWKVSLDIFRKNLVTKEDFNTRLIIGILPEAICETFTHELIFSINYDTQVDLAAVVPNATIYQASLFDNIGMFNDRFWIDHPDLKITISQSALDQPQQRIDLTEEVLV